MNREVLMESAASPHAAGSPASAGYQNRSQRKHRAILDAASGLFLGSGYQGTSMDEIAASAGVSKQTVYKHFADKEQLFEAVVLAALEQAGEPFRAEIAALRQATDVFAGLRELAASYLETVTQPQVLQNAALADCFEDLARRGGLRINDPAVAARHYAFLVIGPALDRSLFCGDETGQAAAAAADTDAAIAVFRAAYAPGG